MLAVIALAEQTALNSISPYLPEMAATFPEVAEGQVGLYVGLIASSFALAASDSILTIVCYRRTSPSTNIPR